MSGNVSRRVALLAGAGAAVAAQSAVAGPARVRTVATSTLPWRGEGAVQRRVVSTRADGESYVLKLAAGAVWQPPRVSELFVVRGSVVLAGQTCGRFWSLRTADEIAAPAGAIVLVMEGGLGAPRVVNTWELPWAYARAWEPASFADAAQPGAPPVPDKPQAVVKPLGERLRLVALMAGIDADERPFAAASDLELFVLQGEGAFGAAGIMGVGSHAAIPRGAACGPWRSYRGAVLLLRFAGPADLVPAHGVRLADPPRGNSVWSESL